MLDAIKGFVASKKAIAMLVGLIMSIFGKKWGLDEQAVMSVVGTIVAYMVAQGVADHGKEAAKVQIVANAPPVQA